MEKKGDEIYGELLMLALEKKWLITLKKWKIYIKGKLQSDSIISSSLQNTT